MAKSKKRPLATKRHGCNPAKREMLIDREVRSINSYLTEMRHRMMWMFIIALDECKSITVDQDTLINITDLFCETYDEYEAIRAKDGDEIADEKLNMRVNRLLGMDPMEDTPAKIRGELTNEE